jgi:hypothetical protein
MGGEFAEEFLNYKLTDLTEPAKKPSLSIIYVDRLDWMNDNILNYYFNYILRIATNYQLYRICYVDKELPTSDDFKLDYKLKFMWLFKLSNLFNYIIKMHSSLKEVLEKMKEYLIMKDLSFLILCDCIMFYKIYKNEVEDVMYSY